MPTPHTRALHPGAWWLWSLGVGVAATESTNLVALLLLGALLTLVALLFRRDAQGVAQFRLYALLAGWLVVMRTLFRVLLQGGGETILLNLPAITLPRALTGAHLLGPISAEALLGGLATGTQLGVLVLCVGAANALASPKHLLAAMPAALSELGTTLVIAVAVFPQLAESVRRVTRSRLLRDDRGPWRHLVRDVMMPVLADTLDRSLRLAGAMDSRGYGRTLTLATSRPPTALLGTAMATLAVGAFVSLSPATGPWGWVLLAAGAGLAWLGFHQAGRRSARTHYRPAPWGVPEWAVTASAVLVVVATSLLNRVLA